MNNIIRDVLKKAVFLEAYNDSVDSVEVAQDLIELMRDQYAGDNLGFEVILKEVRLEAAKEIQGLTDEEVLRLAGWEVECESPFEIRHKDGSFATQNAAWMIFYQLKNEN